MLDCDVDKSKSRKNDLSNYWWNRAESLHSSALILYNTKKDDRIELYDPCLLLAGLSLEVAAKAILVKQKQNFDEQKFSHHFISKILRVTGVSLTESQLATIQLFEESILWLSKYPAPKLSGAADQKTRALFKKVGGSGLLGQVITADPEKWPTNVNYLGIWEVIVSTYWATPTENTNEFGYKLRGIERPWN